MIQHDLEQIKSNQPTNQSSEASYNDEITDILVFSIAIKELHNKNTLTLYWKQERHRNGYPKQMLKWDSGKYYAATVAVRSMGSISKLQLQQ